MLVLVIRPMPSRSQAMQLAARDGGSGSASFHPIARDLIEMLLAQRGDLNVAFVGRDGAAEFTIDGTALETLSTQVGEMCPPSDEAFE